MKLPECNAGGSFDHYISLNENCSACVTCVTQPFQLKRGQQPQHRYTWVGFVVRSASVCNIEKPTNMFVIHTNDSLL